MPDYYTTRKKKLYKVLHEGLPNYRSEFNADVLDVRALAKKLDITYQAVYTWLEKDELPAGRMKTLIELDGSTLTANELLKFVA